MACDSGGVGVSCRCKAGVPEYMSAIVAGDSTGITGDVTGIDGNKMSGACIGACERGEYPDESDMGLSP
jgi:hypothetical protein